MVALLTVLVLVAGLIWLMGKLAEDHGWGWWWLVFGWFEINLPGWASFAIAIAALSVATIGMSGEVLAGPATDPRSPIA